MFEIEPSVASLLRFFPPPEDRSLGEAVVGVLPWSEEVKDPTVLVVARGSSEMSAHNLPYPPDSIAKL